MYMTGKHCTAVLATEKYVYPWFELSSYSMWTTDFFFVEREARFF